MTRYMIPRVARCSSGGLMSKLIYRAQIVLILVLLALGAVIVTGIWP